MIDRTYVLNLNRRHDRLLAFTSRLPIDWPFAAPVRYPAVDGALVTVPDTWQHTPGAYGCLQSHIEMLSKAHHYGCDSVLILEDDAVFCEDFSWHAERFMESLPYDWEIAYLGGCLRRVSTDPPEQVSNRVCRAFTVFGTFGYAVRGTFIPQLLEYLSECTEHIDRWYGQLHLDRKRKVYVPTEWLISHAGGQSDIRNTDRVFEPFVFADPITCIQKATECS